MLKPSNECRFPEDPAALLRRAANQTDDAAKLKGMLHFIADNLEQCVHGVPCGYCPRWHLLPGPPCVIA